MIEREKVIKAIEICYSEKHNCTECELFCMEDCSDKLMRNVLELLKEQEPVKPTKSKLSFTHGFNYTIETCGYCGNPLRGFAKYCDLCGHEVKSDD